MPRADAPTVTLREVTDDDLPILFEYQRQPESAAMAAVPARDHEAFMAHWAKTSADPTNIRLVIVADGRVVGDLVCFWRDGAREVGYRIGQADWGRGIATAALAQFLTILTERPLAAVVAKHNTGSLRVLEKCGFVVTGEAVEDDGMTVIHLTLDAPASAATGI